MLVGAGRRALCIPTPVGDGDDDDDEAPLVAETIDEAEGDAHRVSVRDDAADVAEPLRTSGDSDEAVDNCDGEQARFCVLSAIVCAHYMTSLCVSKLCCQRGLA